MQIFRLSTARMQINQITYVIFKPQVSFHLNFVSPFSVVIHNFPEVLAETFYALDKKSRLK